MLTIADEMRAVAVADGLDGALVVGFSHGRGVVEMGFGLGGSGGGRRARERLGGELSLAEEIEGELGVGRDAGVERAAGERDGR